MTTFDGILHEASESGNPFFGATGRLISMFDLMGGGQYTCDQCGRWAKINTFTLREDKVAMVKAGWTFIGGKDYCPKCNSQPTVEPSPSGEATSSGEAKA
jgi:thymidine kinase